MNLSFPVTRPGGDTVELNGHVVPDPYRWLEDGDSAETRGWLAAQQTLTDAFLSTAPTRDEIKDRLTEHWDFPTRSAPIQQGERWFQWRNSGLQNQPVLYVINSPTGDGRVLLDPNTLSLDGTVAIAASSFTSDGSLFAYATSAAGSDWMTWRVRDVETGVDLPDVIEWSKIWGGAWLGDGSGFFYGAFDPPAEDGNELVDRTGNLYVRFHLLGTDQADDPVVFTRPDLPQAMPIAKVTDDGRSVVIFLVSAGATETTNYVRDLDAGDQEWRHLVGDMDSFSTVVAADGDFFYVLTNIGAPRRRVIRLRPGDAPDAWQDVVHESEHMLTSVRYIGGKLVCHYLRHAASRVEVVDLDGTHSHDIALPEYSCIEGLWAEPALPLLGISGTYDQAMMFFVTTSFTDPGTVWSHDVSTGATTLFHGTEAPSPKTEIVTDQVFAESVDGTRVPVFLIRRSDAVPDGNRPVLLSGYGGFNIARTPAFDIPGHVWVERGGVLAVAVLRGGGEYGAPWHEAGRLANKQNVFDDFCSVARWLHSSGWSKPARTAIHGASNGGLLIGACLVQHPELFGAAVPEVGVHDMLRFHKFTLGATWVSDYGHPDDPEAFEWLVKYSPLHNVRLGQSYPPTLVMTADHDDRVVPSHSFKFTAALQAAQAGAAPILLRTETAAGHGQGTPAAKLIDARADMFAFLDIALENASPSPSA